MFTPTLSLNQKESFLVFHVVSHSRAVLLSLPDEELGGRNLLLRAGETLLKHGYDKRITPTVERFMPSLRKLWRQSQMQEAVH